MTPPTARPAPLIDPAQIETALTELLDLADAVHAALAAYEHGVLTWHLTGTGGSGRHPREAMYAAFEALYRYARTLTLDNHALRATRAHHHRRRGRPARAPRSGSRR